MNIPSITRVSRPYPTDLGYVDADDLGLGRFGFRPPRPNQVFRQVTQAVQQGVKSADPRAIAARARGVSRFIKTPGTPVAGLKRIHKLNPITRKAVVTGIRIPIASKNTAGNAETGADAGMIYTDASGKEISEAEYNRLIEESRSGVDTYQDENGNPITKEEFDRRMAEFNQPVKPPGLFQNIAVREEKLCRPKPGTGKPFMEQGGKGMPTCYYDANGNPITQEQYKLLTSDSPFLIRPIIKPGWGPVVVSDSQVVSRENLVNGFYRTKSSSASPWRYFGPDKNEISESEYQQRIAPIATPIVKDDGLRRELDELRQQIYQERQRREERREERRKKRESERAQPIPILPPTPAAPAAPAAPVRPASVPANADQVGSGWIWVGQNPEMTSVPAILASKDGVTRWFPWGPMAGQQARQWLGVSGLGDFNLAGMGLGTMALLGIGAYFLFRKK